MSRDRGGDWVLSPVGKASVDQNSRREEARDDDERPEEFDSHRLGGGNVGQAVDGGGVQELG